MVLSNTFMKEGILPNKPKPARKKSTLTGDLNWKELVKKGEIAIPKLITDLELNKLSDERPKITPNVLKNNADQVFKKHIKGIRFFWRYLAITKV